MNVIGNLLHAAAHDEGGMSFSTEKTKEFCLYKSQSTLKIASSKYSGEYLRLTESRTKKMIHGLINKCSIARTSSFCGHKSRSFKPLQDFSLHNGHCPDPHLCV